MMRCEAKKEGEGFYDDVCGYVETAFTTEKEASLLSLSDEKRRDIIEISTEWSEEDKSWDRFCYSDSGKTVPTSTPIGVEFEGDGDITFLYKGISFCGDSSLN